MFDISLETKMQFSTQLFIRMNVKYIKPKVRVQKKTSAFGCGKLETLRE